MEYENYVMWMNFSYEEFRAMMETLAINVIKSWMIITAVFLTVFIIYALKKKKHKLDPESYRKFKMICEWENRSREDQTKHIIKMYIDAYSEKNGIDWEQRLY